MTAPNSSQSRFPTLSRCPEVATAAAGLLLKVNPFGFFVELDPDIQGLAHVSELSDKPVEDPTKIGKPGDTMRFRVVSVEPNEHRLGLSLKEESKAAEVRE